MVLTLLDCEPAYFLASLHIFISPYNGSQWKEKK